jgi:hypothetical protein
MKALEFVGIPQASRAAAHTSVGAGAHHARIQSNRSIRSTIAALFLDQPASVRQGRS